MTNTLRRGARDERQEAKQKRARKKYPVNREPSPKTMAGGRSNLLASHPDARYIPQKAPRGAEKPNPSCSEAWAQPYGKTCRQHCRRKQTE